MLRRKLFTRIVVFVVIAVALIWTLVPLAWILLSSFKFEADQFSMPPKWFPERITFQNYAKFFGNSEFVSSLINSVMITFFSTVIALMLGVPAAYALARFDWKHANTIAFVVLLARMTPPIVMVLPFFMIARYLGISNTYLPIVLALSFFSVPFAIWMMRGFFQEIPTSLEEAAMIDGCTRFQSLRIVVLPLVMPGLSATSILCALIAWNEFLFALVLTGRDTRPLPVLVNMFVSERNIEWGVMSAAAIITVLPMIVFGLLVQNDLVRGLTMGSSK
ncbi:MULTISPECIES: carbohydrate ABC transporter permease [unclassified Mesotoga]|uniref:carbohydrate ABC transporter permease n=1 Tax=unclassified Mesotoga TaxID=1184398 RepID=UPI000EF1790C|nr:MULTISPECIES: carbohydrate ABC transporter permease [unclassified Mesotoga]MDD3680931.1 carbohydrate ABC transporter permease [Mesotoga sp.]MDD4207994.1 carbohydrate ABC transporter permease [Mesotoga sp.]MDD4825332.1 carbohydrate ABC transporter permease [Mesotoga sp.]MDD5683149.1 carbohydrate ABC transporter permease [Mesotoga sp.]RLL83650.1 ABC transporter permease [Mesotoga sp. BH458_6_3_2_1]